MTESREWRCSSRCTLGQPDGGRGPAGAEEITAPCAVVVDGSGSGEKFDAVARTRATLKKFLADQKCGKLAFIPLNGVSNTSTCTETVLDLDPDLGDPDEIRASRRALAEKRALELLTCAKQENSRSDVLGALQHVARARPEGTGAYQVLIVSDMMQSGNGASVLHADLSTPQLRAGEIQKLTSRIPDLSGVVLYPTDLGRGVYSGQSAENVRNFWTELLAAKAGKPTLEETYGA